MSSAGLANAILSQAGGAKNVVSIDYCATRLRLTLHDDSKVDLKHLRSMEEVVAAVFRSGQLQIILGTGIVLQVYNDIQEMLGAREAVNAAGPDKPIDVQAFMRRIANVFLPLIPALVGGGMLMGLNYVLQRLGVISPDNQISQMLGIFSSAIFVFLTVLVGVTTAREFGGNPMLGGAVAGILMHPALDNIKTLDFAGIQLTLHRGAGGIVAALLVVWFMCWVEKRVRKFVPDMLALILTPVITLVITGFTALYILQPIGSILSDVVVSTVTFAINKGGFFTGMVLGAVYSTIVTTGLHQGFNPLYLDMLAKTGVNALLPVFAMADTAQAGAALAVYFKTGNERLKKIALNAIPVCLLGITEPVMFAVNIPLVKPFIAAAAGGALGGGFIAMMQVKAISLGLSTIPIIAIIKEGYVLQYIVGFAIAFTSAFIVTWLLGFNDNVEGEELKIGKF